MQEKYHKYWLDISLLYGLSFVLDHKLILNVFRAKVTQISH